MPDEPTRPEHDTGPRPGHSASGQAPTEPTAPAQPTVPQPEGAQAADGVVVGWPARSPQPGWHAGATPPGGRQAGSDWPAGDWPTGDRPAGDRPEGDRPAGDFPGDEDDDDWPDDDEPGTPWPPPSAGGVAEPRRRRLVTLAVIAVAALAVGAGVTAAVTSELSPAAPAAARHTQSPQVTGPGGPNGPGSGPGTGVPGGSAQMFIAGPVQAISAKSITLGSPGRTVTAAITSATRVSGRVTSVSQIKAGDNVSAQITMRNGKPVVTAIQYPAQLPSGGGQP